MSHQRGTHQKQELSKQFSVNCHSDTRTRLTMRGTQPPKQSLTSQSFLAHSEGRIDNKLETFNLVKCQPPHTRLADRSKASTTVTVPLIDPKAVFNCKKESLTAFPQSHRSRQVAPMKEQVKNLKRVLLREFTVNCHFYPGMLASMKDRTLLIVSQLSFAFKVPTPLPLHRHGSVTSTGFQNNSSMQRPSGNTSETNKEQTGY